MHQKYTVDFRQNKIMFQPIVSCKIHLIFQSGANQTENEEVKSSQ